MSKTPDTATKMLRAVRLAERRAGDGSDIGGTGYTTLKRTDSPLQRLLAASRGEWRIGGEELRAADEILAVFSHITAGLWIKPLSMEKRDRSHGGGNEPHWFIDAYPRYRRWVDHWSVRAKRGDPTLSIVIAAIVDERPFREIEADVGIRNGRAAKATVHGLRDYAARARWCSSGRVQEWMGKAADFSRLTSGTERGSQAVT